MSEIPKWMQKQERIEENILKSLGLVPIVSNVSEERNDRNE